MGMPCSGEPFKEGDTSERASLAASGRKQATVLGGGLWRGHVARTQGSLWELRVTLIANSQGKSRDFSPTTVGKDSDGLK